MKIFFLLTILLNYLLSYFFTFYFFTFTFTFYFYFFTFTFYFFTIFKSFDPSVFAKINKNPVCYMNSLLQQLYMIPTLRNAILYVDDPKFKSTKKEDNILYQLKVK